MRQWKKFMLVLMCTGVMAGVTACGNNADDNAANDNAATEGTTGDQTDGIMNDNTEDDALDYGNTTDRNNTTGKDDVTDRNSTNGGVMDEIGDDVRDGVDDIGDTLDPDDNVNNGTQNTR